MKSRNHTRITGGELPCAWEQLRVCVLAGLIAVFPVLGACGLDSAGFLFLHPYFEGKNWSLSAKTIETVIPEKYCEASPAEVAVGGNDSTGVFVLADSAGELHLGTVSVVAAGGLCGQTRLIADSLESLSLTVPPGARLYALRTGRADTVLLAVGSGDSVMVYQVEAEQPGAAGNETLALSTMPGGASVRALGGDRAGADGGDTGLWIGGEQGILRYVRRNAGGWGAEQSFDIDPSQDITAVGEGFAGTAAGKIYSVAGGGAVEEATFDHAVRAISGDGAAGDSGMILVRNGGWSAYRDGTASYRLFNPTARGSGSAFELLDRHWSYHAYTYADSMTHIAATEPPAYAQGVNGDPQPVVVGSDTITVMLEDLDGNYGVPAVWLGGGDESLAVLDPVARELHRTNPAMACSVGYAEFADTGLLLVPHKDSLVVSTTIRRGTFDFSCYTCVWSKQVLRLAQPWGSGDTAMIAVDGDTLRLLHGGGSTVAAHRVRDGYGTPGIRVARTATGLIVRVPGATAEDITAMRILDLKGRELLATPLRGSTGIVLPPAARRATLLVQFVCTGGAVQTTRLLPRFSPSRF